MERQERDEEDEFDDGKASKIDFERIAPGDVKSFPTFLERYTREWFAVIPDEEDHWVRLHSNGLLIVGVSRTHPVARLGAPRITGVAFGGSVVSAAEAGRGGKRRSSSSSSMVQKETVIAEATLADGKKYRLRGCVFGRVVEFNRRLLESPSLLQEKPHTEGFLVILRPPRDSTVEQIVQGLVPQEEFCKLRGVAASSLSS